MVICVFPHMAILPWHLSSNLPRSPIKMMAKYIAPGLGTDIRLRIRLLPVGFVSPNPQDYVFLVPPEGS